MYYVGEVAGPRRAREEAPVAVPENKMKVDTTTVLTSGVGALGGGLAATAVGPSLGFKGKSGKTLGMALGALAGFMYDQRAKKKAAGTP